mmetsp:Transcript_47632/g.120704  ORF Transcript_47632/g.120704 Transcript_47632/m.120704 type:complete len:266 (+) Transcript_47632:195-992(+)
MRSSGGTRRLFHKPFLRECYVRCSSQSLHVPRLLSIEIGWRLHGGGVPLGGAPLQAAVRRLAHHRSVVVARDRSARVVAWSGLPGTLDDPPDLYQRRTEPRDGQGGVVGCSGCSEKQRCICVECVFRCRLVGIRRVAQFLYILGGGSRSRPTQLRATSHRSVTGIRCISHGHHPTAEPQRSRHSHEQGYMGSRHVRKLERVEFQVRGFEPAARLNFRRLPAQTNVGNVRLRGVGASWIIVEHGRSRVLLCGLQETAAWGQARRHS